MLKIKGKHSELVCTMHPQEEMSVFCTDCATLTCRNCQLFNHREHSYKFIDEVIEETHSTFENLFDEMGYELFYIVITSHLQIIY